MEAEITSTIFHWIPKHQISWTALQFSQPVICI